MLNLAEKKKYLEAGARAPDATNGRSDVNISRVANIKLPTPALKPYSPFSFTSNCQCAAWRSCFAWSAAQPAVRTNWLIMTWCLSSSIFDEARVLLAAAGYEADFLPFSSLSSLWLYSVSVPQSSTITAGSANTNIYCRSGSGRSMTWLTGARSQSRESIAGGICMLRAEGLCSAFHQPAKKGYI